MESRFQEALDAISEKEIVELEEQMVAIPSYTTEEAELAEFIADYLNDNGVEVGLQRVPFPNNTGGSSSKSYNVIGKIHGMGQGPSLMFNGHMDHGPLDGRKADDLSKWARPPFRPTLEDGYLYGKGSQDEKGGLCAMLIAAITVRRLNLGLRGDLILTPVCGHKSYSSGTRHLLSSGLRADMAINTENSGNAIVPLHVGVLTARIDLEGAHPHPTQRRRFPGLASQSPPFARILRLLESIGPESVPYDSGGWLRFEPHPILKDFPWHHVDKVESHGFLGKSIHLWYHVPPGVTGDTLKADLERLIVRLAEDDPGFRAQVKTRAFGPALETPLDAPLVQMLRKWHRDASGDEPTIGAEARYGLYGDASLLSEVGITSVVYGPGGGLTDLDYEWEIIQGLTSPDERIRVRDLIVAAKVLTLAAIGICG
jgi:acetylornithine deacetylase/succinyl-diaminopimelate desuccinylase-like protein